MMDIEKFKDRLSFDPDAGVFVWKKPRKGICVGAIAGSKNDKGYVVIRLDGAIVKAHRLAWAMHYGEIPKGHLDHVDRDRSNNRISNLRLATASQNRMNAPARKSASGVKGVTWKSREQRWCVQVGVAGKRIYGGMFTDLDEARAVAERLINETHKEFAAVL